MTEEFLHFIWENRLHKSKELLSTTNEKIEIIKPGFRNPDAGPDFFNARIKIDDTTWAGNVEIHQNSSDWYNHKHHTDEAYDNVILHVIDSLDRATLNSKDKQIPTLVLNYPKRLEANFEELQKAKTWIACQNQFYKIDPLYLKIGYHRLMIERLESKTGEIVACLNNNKNNWNETFYIFLAKMFGFKTNAVPFELLAKSLPETIFSKHKNNLHQLEALLFGNAGFLNAELLGDDYFLSLRNEYSYLYKKYKLKPIANHLWKFMRLRPVNFPTIRISQFASLIHKSTNLFSKIIEIKNLEQLRLHLKVKASAYWNSHYKFNKESVKGTKSLGDDSINLIIINVIVPFLFVYGETQSKPQLKDRALDFLSQLPPEKNSIITNWKKLAVTPISAFETQALLQLKNSYCKSKKCLNCHLGNKLIKSYNTNEPTG